MSSSIGSRTTLVFRAPVNTGANTRNPGRANPRRLYGVGRYVIEQTERTSGSPAAVYRLLRDGATWPEWGPLETFELERDGDGEPEGVGAIRVFGSGRLRGRDQITGFDEDRAFRYIHLVGLPVRNYEAEVTIVPAGSGCDITWHITFDPKFPFTGMFVYKALNRFIAMSVQGLANRAAAG